MKFGSGDDGYTGMRGPGRVPKYDPRLEALGALDEATSALGLGRASATDSEVRRLVLELQRQLSELMAELAASAESPLAQRRRIGPEEVELLDREVQKLSQTINWPGRFILPGTVSSSAGLDLARAMLRRAERRVAWLVHQKLADNPELIRYLNRASSLAYLLARREEQAQGVAQDLANH